MLVANLEGDVAGVAPREAIAPDLGDSFSGLALGGVQVWELHPLFVSGEG